MGGYLLIQDPQPAATFGTRPFDVMRDAGFAAPRRLRCPGLSVYYYDKLTAPAPTLFEGEHGDFCLSVGTLFYKGLYGVEASRRLYKDFDPHHPHLRPEDLDGSFTVLLHKGGRLFLFSDPLGTYRNYHSRDHAVWSSSFLATVAAADGLTLLPQAIYEYVFQGATYGQDTPFAEIRMADGEYLYDWDCGAPRPQPIRRIRPFPLPDRPDPEEREALLEVCLDRLRQQFATVARHFGDRVDTALSGGYDSRLMLALLFEAGVAPRIHVYGREEDPDVRVAKAIARGEGFPLTHTDKSRIPAPAPEAYPEILRRNFYVMDGLPNEGLFDNGQNVGTRQDRVRGDILALNGGGGEIFRDFFHLPDRSFTVRDVIRCFYSQYDPGDTGPLFHEKNYRDTLAAKIRAALHVEGRRLSRTQVEAVYPLFRLRYWMGRNTALNSRFGPAFTPFSDYQLIRAALALPMRDKFHGDFEAELIRRTSPALAAYLSDYDYDFAAPAPFRARLKNRLTLHRPLVLRHHSFALKNRLRRPDRSLFLSPEYAGRLPDPSHSELRDYFDLARLTHPEQLNRIYSLELVLQFARCGKLPF